MLDPTMLTDTLSVFLWIIFAAAAGLAIAVGSILSFHWLRYAMHPAAPAIAIMTYALVCFMCLSVMFGVIAVP